MSHMYLACYWTAVLSVFNTIPIRNMLNLESIDDWTAPLKSSFFSTTAAWKIPNGVSMS